MDQEIKGCFHFQTMARDSDGKQTQLPRLGPCDAGRCASNPGLRCREQTTKNTAVYVCFAILHQFVFLSPNFFNVLKTLQFR